MKEKKHRLPDVFYTGGVAAVFTLCCMGKQEFFVNEKPIAKCLEILKTEISVYNVKNWAYVFMPDHMHMILQGMSTESSLTNLVKAFKQKTAYQIKNKINNKFKWQPDYYDHIIRSEQELCKHIKYVFENPVRKGLVERWQDYKYCGSLSTDIKD